MRNNDPTIEKKVKERERFIGLLRVFFKRRITGRKGKKKARDPHTQMIARRSERNKERAVYKESQ